MILTRVHPAPTEQIDTDAADSRDRLLEWYRPPTHDWLRINLVLGISGNATGSDHTSTSLSSPTDRRILGVIRQLGDLILAGAQSVRAEGYQLPRSSRLAIVTSSGNLDGHQLSDPSAVTVICPESATDRVATSLPGAEVLSVPTEETTLRGVDIVSAARSAGYRSIVCEGGPTLASLLVHEGLVDELCITTSPVLRDASPTGFAATGVGEHPLSLEQLVIDDDDFVFARWLTRGRSTND
ncbi:riboflavin biosynthesis pyrimidine reductase [Microbacteriaceae bacterium SG_E_30_P1]|uniref:Riboflavin biosynthesis pyrimidine reductase n=1 Tax=Antiquaquibacter oligotrophicus TaxID=2880260 RepID=A0ABT6KME7_9MICO|nr:dihydrofolate reductase family protein [Antiquaquibacter oligotrophicus]MDH6181024.1 riboflavin biosynthesis pyrimidine reductase [Antiquaquibacter oligotrophicus]UDF13277.1 dihydrofolate reductase family protein [Antiquaquibacter oligotrophicus]